MSKDTPEKSAIDISQVLEVLKTLLPQGVATAEMAQKAFSMALERQGARSPFETFKATTADDVSPVLAIDPENRIAYANKSAETLFGSLAETLKERSILEWLPKEEATAFGAKLDVFRARQAGLPTEAQTERSVLTLRMDTHKVQTRYNLVPAGENLGIILNDMGERETLKAAVNYLPCGVSVIDRDLRVIAWNEEVLRLQDYSRHLFKNRLPTFGEVVRDICERGDYGEVDTEAKVAEMEALAHKFEPHHIVRERSDGTVLDIRGAPIPGGGFVTTYTDVTEQHRQEMEIKRLVKELAQANQAKSTFLAAASHDLRQPMQAITLFTAALADILREKSATDLDLARHITKSLEGSVDSLGALLNSILDISKMEAGVVVPEIKVFDIDDVLSQLVRQTQATVDKRVCGFPTSLAMRWSKATRPCCCAWSATFCPMPSATHRKAAFFWAVGARAKNCPFKCGTPGLESRKTGLRRFSTTLPNWANRAIAGSMAWGSDWPSSGAWSTSSVIRSTPNRNREKVRYFPSSFLFVITWRMTRTTRKPIRQRVEYLPVQPFWLSKTTLWFYRAPVFCWINGDAIACSVNRPKRHLTNSTRRANSPT